MNILLVNTRLTGGAGIACYRQYCNLKKAGYNVRILCLEEHSLADPNIASFRKFLKKRTDFSKVISFFQEAFNDRKIKKRLKKNGLTFGEFRFTNSIFDICQHPFYEWADCLNLHWVTGFLDWSSFFKKNKKPIIWSMHDMLPFSGGFHYRTGLEISKHKNIIAKIEAQKQKCLEGQDIHVVALSKWLLKESKKSKLFKKFPHYLIPNGLDADFWKKVNPKFSREILGLPKDKKLILFSAVNLENERKGGKKLLEALKELDFPEEDLGIVLLGLNHKTIQEQIGYATYSLGFVNDNRLIKAVYSACDLVVIPSIEDNLPNVVLESNFCGVPVVGFEIGGMLDMIKDNVNGFLAKEITSLALSKALSVALEKNWDAQSISQYISEFFSGERQILLYQTIFNKMKS